MVLLLALLNQSLLFFGQIGGVDGVAGFIGIADGRTGANPVFIIVICGRFGDHALTLVELGGLGGNLPGGVIFGGGDDGRVGGIAVVLHGPAGRASVFLSDGFDRARVAVGPGSGRSLFLTGFVVGDGSGRGGRNTVCIQLFLCDSLCAGGFIGHGSRDGGAAVKVGACGIAFRVGLAVGVGAAVGIVGHDAVLFRLRVVFGSETFGIFNGLGHSAFTIGFVDGFGFGRDAVFILFDEMSGVDSALDAGMLTGVIFHRLR